MLGLIALGVVVLLVLYCWRFGSWDLEMDGPFLHKSPLNPFGLQFVFSKEYKNNVVDHMLDLHNKLGKTLHMNVMGIDLVSTTDLNLIEKVINNRDDFQAMSNFRDAIVAKMGPSMFMSEGERWAQKHKALQPLLHIRMLKHNVDVVNEKTAELVQLLRSKLNGQKKQMEVFIYVRRLFVEVIGQVAFGAQFYDRIFDWLQERGLANDIDPSDPEGKSKKLLHMAETFFDALAYRLLAPRILWNVGKVAKAEAITVDAFKYAFEKRIEEFKEEKKQWADNEDSGPVNLLSLLDTQASDLYPPDEIMGECFSFFMAGHDTTASSSGFIIGLLSQHPVVQAKLREEVKQILAEKKESKPDGVDLHLNFDDVSKMKYGHAVIKETMRLYPVAPGLPREAVRDTVVNGIKFKKGTNISCNSSAIMKSEEYYDKPLEFIPERWLNDNPTKVNSPYVYLPFGAGVRSCFGQRFAVLEMKVVMAYLVYHFNIQAVPEKPFGADNIFGLTLKNRELWISLQPIDSN